MKFSNHHSLPLEIQIWNKFVSVVTMSDFKEFEEPLKSTALIFWYDAEVNNGGHSAYFDSYSNVLPEEIINALNNIGAYCFAHNLSDAYSCGQEDDYIESDRRFGCFTPPLIELLQNFVLSHAHELGII